jgi:hypothetical protein
VRNIAIADRKDWVFSPPAPPPEPPRFSKLRDALATIPILLLGPALIAPFLITSAATASMRVKPEAPNPGDPVTITGTGFDGSSLGSLVWSEDASELAAYSTTRRGKFIVKVTLPESIDVGVHELVALDADGTQRATLEIQVGSAAPDPTPEPTPEPTPRPTPEPTPDPTPRPTPEPTPEPTTTAQPTATPTPAATATPAPARASARPPPARESRS